jgi:hypothetical protein
VLFEKNYLIELASYVAKKVRPQFEASLKTLHAKIEKAKPKEKTLEDVLT